MKKQADLADPRVDHAHRTSRRCPEEYVGRLVDGRWFHYTYRWGRAVVGVGHTIEDAIDDRHPGREYGNMFDGEWADTHSRNEAFRDLLTDALATPEPVDHTPPCPACGSTNVRADDGRTLCLDCRQTYIDS